MGFLKDSEKHGLGTLTKYRAHAHIKPLFDQAHKSTRENFNEIVEYWLNLAKKAETKAKRKSQIISENYTMLKPLDEVLKLPACNMTAAESEAKRKRRVTKMQMISAQFVGEWKEGRRHGWGGCIFKNGDQYTGFFNHDKLHGRGLYWFSSDKTVSLLYIGEFIDNCLQGLGRMLFRDGSLYDGSFVNGSLNGRNEIMLYSNGDKYQGGFQASKRNGTGEYKFDLKNSTQHPNEESLVYEGSFRDDLREGRGVLTFKEQEFITEARADYKDDKRHKKNVELILRKKEEQGDIIARYKGSVNSNEQMEGQGRLELIDNKITYEGAFKED